MGLLTIIRLIFMRPCKTPKIL